MLRGVFLGAAMIPDIAMIVPTMAPIATRRPHRLLTTGWARDS
jgi:hypothetical protein